jgi:hypothetical protein
VRIVVEATVQPERDGTGRLYRIASVVIAGDTLVRRPDITLVGMRAERASTES